MAEAARQTSEQNVVVEFVRPFQPPRANSTLPGELVSTGQDARAATVREVSASAKLVAAGNTVALADLVAGGLADLAAGGNAIALTDLAAGWNAVDRAILLNADGLWQPLAYRNSFDLDDLVQQQVTEMATSDDLTDAKIGKVKAEIGTSIAELKGQFDVKFAGIDHKIDGLGSKMDALSALVTDARTDMKQTQTEARSAKSVIVGTIIGSTLAIAAIVVSLWLGGLNIQSNLLTAFQTGLNALQAKAGPPPPAGQ